MTGPSYIDAAAVAGLMELDGAAAFQRRRAELEARHGFPPPVPWSRRPMKWRASDVEAWIAGARFASGEAAGGPDAARRVVMLHRARASS